MALRSNLALWTYTAPGAPVPVVLQDYGAEIEGLEFTTVAPGGFGDLACILKLPDARLPRPELGLFSRVVLRDGLFTCFSGEWADPALILDATHGDYVLLSALGGGVSLRDDPDDSNYTAKTATQIIGSEFSKRSNYLALDSDLAAVLPNNPASTFSPAYDGYNLEEILHDLMGLLGDYTCRLRWTGLRAGCHSRRPPAYMAAASVRLRRGHWRDRLGLHQPRCPARLRAGWRPAGVAAG